MIPKKHAWKVKGARARYTPVIGGADDGKVYTIAEGPFQYGVPRARYWCVVLDGGRGWVAADAVKKPRKDEL